MSSSKNADSGAKTAGASNKQAAKKTATKKMLRSSGAKALTTSAGKVGWLRCL